jgi:PAS domain S-box-containing protein
MADAAPILMWASGPDKQCVWFNKRWTDFVGRCIERELGSGWAENIHPEDRDRCLREYEAHVDTRENFAIEYRLRRHDGAYRWMLNTGVPLLSSNGAFGGYVGSCIDITEQKLGQAALRESEYRVQLLSESAPVMIWMSDASGKCVHLNRRLREFWGIGADALPDFDWSAAVHPDDRTPVGAVVQQALQDRTGFTFQMRLRNHRGEYRTIRTDAQAHHAQSGEFLGLIGVNIDMTDEARITQALGQSEERFARFMHHLPGLAWIKDENGRYMFANEAATQAFGTTLDGLIGRTDDELFSPEIAAEFRANDALAHGASGRARVFESLRHPNGVLHHAVVSKFAIPNPDGNGALTGGVAIDVTDHKAAEARIAVLNEHLKQRLEEQEALLGALPVGVFIARDRECKEIFTNNYGAKILGLPEGSNASKSGPDGGALPFRVFSGGREVMSSDLPMQRCARLGIPVHGEELDLVFDDGRTITLHESISPLFDDSGGVRGCVGIFVDITERKQAERQKNLFIDELNHRVKNTLAIVQSIAAQTLRQNVEPHAFKVAFTGRLDALARAHSLLTSALWEGVDLPDLVKVALTPFETVTGQVTLSGPSIVIKPDGAVTLALVLHELATNAAKYGALSTPAGRVSITWTIEGPSIVLRWSESHGPPAGEPARKGFGSRLISASASQLGGTAEVSFLREGVRATLMFPAREQSVA